MSESAINLKPQPDVATRLLAGVSVPDTPTISRAIEFAREKLEPYLFNHVMRSWLFAALLAQRKQTAHDGEVLAVTRSCTTWVWRKPSTDRCDLK